MRIFVSSTFEDSREHRAAAIRVLRQLGHEVLAMEDMVAAANTPLAKVLEMVDRAEAYVGIFAWRYGYVPEQGPGMGQAPVVPGAQPGNTSITHYEYLRAHQNSLPVLGFLLDERAPWPPSMTDGHQRSGDAPGDASRIRALRSQLQQERIVAWFTTPADLEARVAAGITMTGLSRRIDLAESVSMGMGPGSAPLNDSGGHAIAQGIAAAGPAQRVLKIDLQEVWWSTRLYLAAALAERLTQVRWLLVVDSAQHPGEERFLGLVATSAVFAVLSRMHPICTSRNTTSSPSPSSGPPALRTSWPRPGADLRPVADKRSSPRGKTQSSPSEAFGGASWSNGVAPETCPRSDRR